MIEQIGVGGITGGLKAQEGAVDGRAFSKALEGAIKATNSQINAGDAHTEALAAGEAVSLHDTMLAVEKADLAVRTLVTVKNKALEAYQEVMRMQL